MMATLGEAAYQAAFEAEQRQDYPAVEAFETRMGYALDRTRLETAARVLACPLKKHLPNWQHGRVLYAATRKRLLPFSEVTLLDIGTAKGFSALCLLWALQDAGCQGRVWSVDVLDPDARVARNTVAEVDGFKTLAEMLAPWPESKAIHFSMSTGAHWLVGHPERVHVAFVDGKHSYQVVSWEAVLLAERQRSGDLAIFDDVQIPGVAQALAELHSYDFEYVDVLPMRRYAIGRRK